MIRILYADWDKLDRDGRFDLQFGKADIKKISYVEVAKFSKREVNWSTGEEYAVLNKMWEIFNTQAHVWKVRSMCIGDIVELNGDKYLVGRYGFDKVEF